MDRSLKVEQFDLDLVAALEGVHVSAQAVFCDYS